MLVLARIVSEPNSFVRNPSIMYICISLFTHPCSFIHCISPNHYNFPNTNLFPEEMFSIMFAFGGRAVCPSCKRPLWRCLSRLPYNLLLNWTSSNDDTNATVADLRKSAAETLLDSKGLKERIRKKERLLDC